MYGCKKAPNAVVGNATTERLNETWAACMEHVPKVIRFITERDEAWGTTTNRVVIAEVAKLDLPGEER
jgi:hypothetical protein